MKLEETILETVRRLPPAKQRKVLTYADELEDRDGTAGGPSQSRSRELKWIEEHRDAYSDQWVAVEGDRLVAADGDALKVFAAAKAEGIQSPFVVHIVPKDPYPFVSG